MSDTTFVYLASAAGHHMFNEVEWRQLLQLARDYGWSPAGTLPPPGQDELNWDQSYLPPHGQVIGPRDAGTFAEALERALVDVPADPNRAVTAPQSVSPAGVAVLERYRGPRVALLKRLILSGQAGDIRIQPTGRF